MFSRGRKLGKFKRSRNFRLCKLKLSLQQMLEADLISNTTLQLNYA